MATPYYWVWVELPCGHVMYPRCSRHEPETVTLPVSPCETCGEPAPAAACQLWGDGGRGPRLLTRDHDDE